MILLIDNYDSFSYNVYQLVGSVNPDIRVIRNDECSVDEIRAMNPSHIILSPGPGRPDKAGVCENVIRELGGRIPILGICLGHQAICEVAGATVTYASHLLNSSPNPHSSISCITHFFNIIPLSSISSTGSITRPLLMSPLKVSNL